MLQFLFESEPLSGKYIGDSLYNITYNICESICRHWIVEVGHYMILVRHLNIQVKLLMTKYCGGDTVKI